MSWDVWLTTEVDGHEITVDGPGFNYTHNCNQMIRDAGLTEWPYDVDGWKAGELGQRLDDAIKVLESDPKRFRAMDPANGWGSYDSLLPVIREVRDHCRTYPSTKVRMSA
jgi:hypothetical protein